MSWAGVVRAAKIVAAIYLAVLVPVHVLRWSGWQPPWVRTGATEASPPAAAAAKREAPVTGDAAIVAGLVPACRSQQDVKDVMEIVRSRDKEAYEAAMRRRIDAGACEILPNGAAVHVAELAVWQGLARVRRKGRDEALWLPHRMIDKDLGGSPRQKTLNAPVDR